MNEKEFDYLGITAFHNAGYKGQGITIASKENVLENTFNDVIAYEFEDNRSNKFSIHGTNVMDYIRQVAPAATKVTGEMTGTTYRGVLYSKSWDYLMEQNPDILTTSFFISSDIMNPKKDIYQELYNNDCFLCCAAGNEGDEGCEKLTQQECWLAIGACRYNNGKPKKASYSSTGKELDFMSFDNLYATWKEKRNTGTSFASPLFAAMCALVQCFFKEKTGKKLSNYQLYRFVKDNCQDLETDGRDNRTGYGLFILPPPETINIYRYGDVKMFKDYTEWENAIEFLAEQGEMDSPNLWLKRIEENNDINLKWFCIKWANAVAKTL